MSVVVDQTQHREIRRRLRASGSSFLKIARELAITPTTVVTASLGRCKSRRVEEAIAGKLGTSPEALWPDRYDEEEDEK
ncbi:helix-turn-helix domain-containing protein [Paracoccus fistulariae]|uniref:Helix-turn-helix domain-containing protein n=1 Tax=Paracoccus fistulariae TaxID=658446 RepID=A0ABY7SHM6_9RHOB|nr:helix-turn-helix domain-containing protein [Paracoccus fistulariae]MDB6181054.1 helix-turn-helix domain-containing protein [Paracoccus fistulariae]WCR06349.1 helix-turn-helix domain-containing protein [Paracoccus fistulariae]